jgi:hypothetical protein
MKARIDMPVTDVLQNGCRHQFGTQGRPDPICCTLSLPAHGKRVRLAVIFEHRQQIAVRVDQAHARHGSPRTPTAIAATM